MHTRWTVLAVAMLVSPLGCSVSSLSQRVAMLEERVELLTEETLALENRTQTLPQDLESLGRKVKPLEKNIWARQASLAGNVTELKEETLPRLTGQIEQLTQSILMVQRQVDELQTDVVQRKQQQAKGPAVTAPASNDVAQQLERLRDEVLLLQHTTAGLKYLLDHAQADQEQSFASSTAWLSALAAQLERHRELTVKQGRSDQKPVLKSVISPQDPPTERRRESPASSASAK
jgi:uncharacterized protein YoxC